MNNISLSYIIATRNRLPFLKITLERLLDELQPDEEIVVVDGNSTDGTKGYLQELFDAKKIHQLISEADRNQAHAWNKAMLLAKGILIKKIIDDDVFCYTAIRKCKDFMLQNSEVEVLISNDMGCSSTTYQGVSNYSRLPEFLKWKSGMVPSFTFGDVHMLIRRDALSYIGLYNTAYLMLDWEYALRISYLKANIAYFTGYNALSVFHEQSVSAKKNTTAINEQGRRANVFYEYRGDNADISLWSKIKIGVGKILFKEAAVTTGDHADITAIYNFLYRHLDQANHSAAAEFIKSK